MPGTLRIAEVDLYIRVYREALVFGHLVPPVPGQRAPQRRREFKHVLAQRGDDRRSVFAGHFDEHGKTRVSFHLARRNAPARLMLIGTYRPVDVVLSGHPVNALKQDLLVHKLCDEIALEPLGENQVAAYLAADSSGTDLPSGLAGLVHRHSEGNPLFMVAALDHMIERGTISHENGKWKLKGPSGGNRA